MQSNQAISSCRSRLDDPENPFPDLDVEGFSILAKTQSPDEDCCCKRYCGCFGDPHCHDFFATYSVSAQESGSFNYYSSGDFTAYLEQGAPNGIVEKAVVTVNGFDKTFSLDRADCHGGKGNSWRYPDGSFVPEEEYPPSWTILRTQQENLSGGWTQPTDHTIRDMAADVTFVIQCKNFYYGGRRESNLPRGRYTRLDVSLEKSVPGGECCPTDSEFEELTKEDTGYCVAKEDLPGQFVLPTRRLDEIVDASANSRKLDDIAAEDEELAALCSEYAQLVEDCPMDTQPVDIQECMADGVDFTAESIQDLIDLLKAIGHDPPANLCVWDANDPVLMDPLGPCDQGLTLEVKHGDYDWYFLRAFPSTVSYCGDGKIPVLFERTLDKDGNPVNGEDYEFRVTQCEPDLNQCPGCQAMNIIDPLNWNWLYACEADSAKLQIIQDGIVRSVKSGALDCSDYDFAEIVENPFLCINVQLEGNFDPPVVVDTPTDPPLPSDDPVNPCPGKNKKNCREHVQCWWHGKAKQGPKCKVKGRYAELYQ